MPEAQAARFFTNGLDTETRGVDLTARYVVPAGAWREIVVGP
ncbi:MAG: hypothetical protein ACREMK_10830 [Gemmatimonadota bacterium]